ncbi:single-stranded nucleic acid binding R3H [Sporodiniella umbellata]|nr:single-stranded nucleic acid binding R3H [Sporodiniella umbellata]
MSYNPNRISDNHLEQQTRSTQDLNFDGAAIQQRYNPQPSTVGYGDMANIANLQICPPNPLVPQLQSFHGDIASNELDPFIFDLLKKPQERLFLLKVELEIEEFIKNTERFRLGFPSTNSYQRLMIHRLAPYYKLNHFHDGLRKGVYVCKTDSTQMPETRLTNVDISEKTEESPSNPTIQPQFKIMRRSTGSGSVSPRSTEDSKNNTERKNMTLEERKTAYEEARARIFQGIEENP